MTPDRGWWLPTQIWYCISSRAILEEISSKQEGRNHLYTDGGRSKLLSPLNQLDADSSSATGSGTPPRSGPLSAYQHHGASIYRYKALEDPLGRPISPFVLFLSLQKVCRYHERLYFPLLFIYFLLPTTTISVQHRILQNVVVYIGLNLRRRGVIMQVLCSTRRRR